MGTPTTPHPRTSQSHVLPQTICTEFEVRVVSPKIREFTGHSTCLRLTQAIQWITNGQMYGRLAGNITFTQNPMHQFGYKSHPQDGTYGPVTKAQFEYCFPPVTGEPTWIPCNHEACGKYGAVTIERKCFPMSPFLFSHESNTR